MSIEPLPMYMTEVANRIPVALFKTFSGAERGSATY